MNESASASWSKDQNMDSSKNISIQTILHLPSPSAISIFDYIYPSDLQRLSATQTLFSPMPDIFKFWSERDRGAKAFFFNNEKFVENIDSKHTFYYFDD